ncbi:MAG: hypothetical protein CVU38_21085, partial [Chloroflexi bacterium HGW-Chloroflexi-1]
MKRWTIISIVLSLALIVTACGAKPAPTPAPPVQPAPTTAPAAGIDCMGAKSGDQISMLYQWS